MIATRVLIVLLLLIAGFIFGQNSFVANVLTSTTIRHLGLIKKLYESPSTEESAKSSLQVSVSLAFLPIYILSLHVH